MKVRGADDQRKMARSENPAHLSLIRPGEEPRADRADQKDKTLPIKPLAKKRFRKKGPHRPHRPLAQVGRRIRCGSTGAAPPRRYPNERLADPAGLPRSLLEAARDLPPRALGASVYALFGRLSQRPRRRGGDRRGRRGGERRLPAMEACSMGKDVILATASPAALQTARQVKGAT